LKCSKLEGRSHNQPHQRPEKTFFGKHTKQPTSPPKIKYDQENLKKC
jgi:hypothetical protein